MGIAEIIAFILKNWKAFAIGILVLLLLALGYYFRSVLAQRDSAKAQVVQLEKDIGLEKERAKQLESARVLIAADAEKYKNALTNIQVAHDKLDNKYTRLWNKYAELTEDITIEDIPIDITMSSSSTTTSPAVTEKPKCFTKSIVRDIVLIPKGRPTFENLSTAFSKGGAN
jgi:hypothetical protein